MSSRAPPRRSDPAARSNEPDAFARESGKEKLQLKVGGMSCSFCVASITKAMKRMEGVREASVNLAHEETLITYDPRKVMPAQLKETLLDLGYTGRDAGKVQTFEEEGAELRREWHNLLTAAGFAAGAGRTVDAGLAVVPQIEMVYHENDPTGEGPMPEATLEQRMTALEEAVRELQEAMRARKPTADWLDRVIGSMKDEPAFEEVLAHGRAIRQADRPAEDQGL